MTEDYEAKLEAGLKYQDFIMERMHLIGTILQPYSSREGQKNGENMFGLEIKHDRKMQKTGNICIEVQEKACERDGPYVPSGIFRSDNTWLYGIGDYSLFWIFAKSTLRNLHARVRELGLREYQKPTSMGFLLPVTFVEIKNLYARKVLFDFDGKIKEVQVGGDKAPLNLAAIPVPQDFQMRLFP